jgi:hypothetical protein
MSISFYHPGNYSTVVNFIVRKILTINGIPHINIMSTSNVTLLLRLIILSGMLKYSVLTPSDVYRKVFPVIVAISGPNILRAFVMSIRDTGKFLIILDLTMFMKSFREA